MDNGQNENTPTNSTRSFWQWLLVLIIAIVILGTGYYLLSNNGYLSSNKTDSAKSMQTTPTTVMTQTTNEQMAPKQITIEGNEFSFTPSTITVNKGETVNVLFKNIGKYPHNLTVTDLGVATKTVMPGQQDAISFVPDKTGSFQFLCTVPGHADKGMTGTLIVK